MNRVCDSVTSQNNMNSRFRIFMYFKKFIFTYGSRVIMWLVFKYLLFDWMENIMNINTEPEPAFWNSKTLSSPSQLDKKNNNSEYWFERYL